MRTIRLCSLPSRIVTNEGLDLLRRRRRDAVSLDSLTEEDEEGDIAMPSLIADWREDPSLGVERREFRAILDRALDTLTLGLRRNANRASCRSSYCARQASGPRRLRPD